MAKNNFNQILAEIKLLGEHYKANHYEVMGIENFSTYNDKLIYSRTDEARREIKDETDQAKMKTLINEAHATLKEPTLKAKFDETLKIVLERKQSSSGDQKVGFPSLQIENEDSLIFNEVKLGSIVTQTITITNKSGGILNGTILVPKGQNWLDVNPKSFKQSELPLRANISINPISGGFSLGELKNDYLIFSYRTDNGIKEEKKWVEVRTEGLGKKIQRLSKSSIWIFVGLYALLVGLQTINNVGVTMFGVKINFLYRMLTWASIPLLYFFLNDYNLYGFDKLRGIFRRETTRQKLELAGLVLLLFLSFELFLMFVIGIGVLWLNKQVLKTMKIKYGTFYTPIAGLLFYGLIMTQLPSMLQTFTTRQEEPQITTAPNVEVMYVQILKDCNVRAEPSAKGKILFVAKVSDTYKLASNQAINNDWAQISFVQNAIEQIGYVRITQETAQIISK